MCERSKMYLYLHKIENIMYEGMSSWPYKFHVPSGTISMLFFKISNQFQI